MRCPHCDCLNLDDARTCFNCGSSLGHLQTPYAAPSAATAEPRNGFRPIWLLWGCGGVVLLLVLLLGSCILATKGGMAVGEREFGPAIEAYLAQVRAGDYRGAYRDFGEELHQAVKEEDYLALEMGFQEKLGPLRSKTVQFVGAGTNSKGRWGRIVYTCDFEKAKGTLVVSLRKVGDGWKIVEVRYDSPIFLESLKSKNAPKS